jgi:hypothetical protein
VSTQSTERTAYKICENPDFDPNEVGDLELKNNSKQRKSFCIIITVHLLFTMTTNTTINALTVRRKMQLQIIANKAKAKAQQRKLKQEEEEWDDLLGYLAAAILAVGLTLTCPGDTVLWSTAPGAAASTDGEESFSTLNWWLLNRAFVSYVVTIVVYFRLQGSDPGYLNANMLNDLGDGYNARGETIAEESGKEDKAAHDMQVEGMVAVSGTSLSSSSASSSSLPNAMTRRFQRTVPAGAAISDDDPNVAEETAVSVVDTSIQQQYQSTRRPLCPKCKIAPPIRAHHCKQCNRCVATFDHHCDFVGTCIGEKNRCLFWWFLLAQAVSFVLSLAMVESSSIDCLDWYHTGFSWTVLNVCLVKLYVYPLTIAAVAMLLVHTVWALGNSTTFEWSRSKHLEYLQGRLSRSSSRFRFRSPMLDWPFSRGILQNLSYFCLGPSRNDNDNIENVSGGDSSSSSRGKETTTAWKPTIWQPPRQGGRK